ncbi:MAG TPA: EamA family transporter [Longimicrobiaceae bacterium]|nr:EamA family transporter [Longimicrobiaceae bacterium]
MAAERPVSRARAIRLGAYAATWLIWGSTYLAIRYAVAALPPFLLVALRSLAAGAVLVAWGRLRGHRPPSRAQGAAAAVTGALYFLVCHGGLFWAEQRVASGPAALMIATEHFWVVLLAWLLPGGRAPSGRALAGIGVGLAGVALLSLGGGAGGIDPLGAAVLVLGAGAWAGGSLYFQGPRRPESSLYAAGAPLLAGGAMLLAASAAAGEPARVQAADFTPLAVGSLLYLVVFGSVVAFTAFTWLVEKEGAGRAASYAYVNPLVAVLLGWAVAGEALTPRVLAAGAAIVAAVVLIATARRDGPVRVPLPAPPAPVRPPRRLREGEA